MRYDVINSFHSSSVCVLRWEFNSWCIQPNDETQFHLEHPTLRRNISIFRERMKRTDERQFFEGAWERANREKYNISSRTVANPFFPLDSSPMHISTFTRKINMNLHLTARDWNFSSNMQIWIGYRARRRFVTVSVLSSIVIISKRSLFFHKWN